MINAYDIAYGLGLGLAAPFWLIKPSARRKVLKAFSQRMGRVEPRGDDDLTGRHDPRRQPRRDERDPRAGRRGSASARPDLRFIISTTTETGFDRGTELYGSAADCHAHPLPARLHVAVARVLDGLRPSVVVLMELEVWPNFLRQCQCRGIPVVLVNGRLTDVELPQLPLGQAGRRGDVPPAGAACARRTERTPSDSSRSARRPIASASPAR